MLPSVERAVDFFEPIKFHCPVCDHETYDIEDGTHAWSPGLGGCDQELVPVLKQRAALYATPNAARNCVWYHTTTHPDWPLRYPPSSGMFEHAVHIGSYEASVENMLRSIEGQDRMLGDFYLVRLALAPGVKIQNAVYREEDLGGDFMGNVPASTLRLGESSVAKMYVNEYEDKGNISIVTVPENIQVLARLRVNEILDSVSHGITFSKPVNFKDFDRKSWLQSAQRQDPRVGLLISEHEHVLRLVKGRT